MGNYKWNTNSESNEPFVVVLMISRNKDNKDIEGFKERRWAFIARRTDTLINQRFAAFVNDGLVGEMSRLYVSVNARKMENVRKEFLHKLVDKEDFNFAYVEPTVAAIAAKKENAAEHKWIFDFDLNNHEKVQEFINDISAIDTEHPYGAIVLYKTPNGYSVVVEHGFDTRKLMEKWGDTISLKRDDLICINWRKRLC